MVQIRSYCIVFIGNDIILTERDYKFIKKSQQINRFKSGSIYPQEFVIQPVLHWSYSKSFQYQSYYSLTKPNKELKLPQKHKR